MKKHGKLLYIIVFAMLMVLSLCLVACGGSGADGQDGKSAYQIWLDNGNTGTETDFLNWLKGKDGANGNNGDNGTNGDDGIDGTNGKSAFEIFMQYYPYYTGTEKDWINGQLHVYTVTFKSEVFDDIVKYILQGYGLTDVPEVPEKEGQASASWDITDFTNIQQDLTVNAVYVMQTRTVTFHNEFTDEEDTVKTVEYGQALTDIPTVTAKEHNDGYWSVKDFGCIKTDMTVNAVYATQGLQYTLINKQTQYRVSKGEMNTAVKELFIPAEYNGKPVTIIDEHAFLSESKFTFAYIPYGITEIRNNAFGNCYGLTSIEIPNSVTSIEYSAFHDCRSLTSITIPDSITSIENSAFSGCSGLTSITISNGVTSIGDSAFGYCSGLTSITIPDSVTSVGDSAFVGCTGLTNIALGNSVTRIGHNAFIGCSSLTSIAIPDSVTSIDNKAFMNCTLLSTVYYKGTQEQFDKIIVGEYNETFVDSMVYFYSETEPTDDGFYWHYDTDGFPVIWAKEKQ